MSSWLMWRRCRHSRSKYPIDFGGSKGVVICVLLS